MPFADLGGPGFYVEADALAWRAYDFYERTGRNPTRAELLAEEQDIADSVRMCQWFMRYAQDLGKDPFTGE